jgi:hypothetical protein
MNKNERLQLQRMIKANDVEETTGKIRRLKHSRQIKADVEQYLQLKRRYSRLLKTNRDQFKEMARKKCAFIFENYLNLFNKLLVDELDLKILATFLTILGRIEEGAIDQHEGSYEVGKILKELYVDSVVRRESKRDKKKKKKSKKRTINISWSEYKKLQLN